MIEDNSFAKKKGKYTKYPAEIWGNPFYIFVEKDEEGNINQIFEKPNFKEISVIGMISGMHIMPSNPERNHIDWFKDGKIVRKEKTEQAPYYIHENNWFI